METSIKDLKDYLSVHPYKEDPEVYLFFTRDPLSPVSETHLRELIYDIAKKSGIRKHVYPHLLRHSRATHLAQGGMNEPNLRNFFGWSPNSKMPSLYVHLANKDLLEAVKRAREVKPTPIVPVAKASEIEDLKEELSDLKDVLKAQSAILAEFMKGKDIEEIKKAIDSAGEKLELLRKVKEKKKVREFQKGSLWKLTSTNRSIN
ncbi:MAG: tyrosine-type recombinase/integrase [Candidatus Hydrothermarchaeota archaeon]